MHQRLTPELSAILGYSRDEAMRTGHYGVAIDHLLLAILRHADNDATSTLKGLGADLGELKAHIDSQVFREQGIPFGDESRIRLTKRSAAVLNMAVYESLRFRQEVTGASHLLLAISRSQDFSAAGWLEERGITYEALKSYMFAHGMLSPEGDNVMPKAEDIADALEAEIRAALATTGISTDYVS